MHEFIAHIYLTAYLNYVKFSNSDMGDERGCIEHVFVGTKYVMDMDNKSEDEDKLIDPGRNTITKSMLLELWEVINTGKSSLTNSDINKIIGETFEWIDDRNENGGPSKDESPGKIGGEKSSEKSVPKYNY